MSRSIIMKKIATIAMAILMMITATCTGTLSSIAPAADFLFPHPRQATL